MNKNQMGIRELSQQIAVIAAQIADYYDANHLPEPTFEPDSASIPTAANYEALRIPLSQAAHDLLHLVNGPKRFVRTFSFSHYDLAAFQVALEFKFFTVLPLRGSINLPELAKAVGFDEDRAGSVIRLLATQRIFEETEQNVFRHTAISALVAIDEDIRAAAHMKMDEMFRASSDTAECIRNSPYESGNLKSPFKTRYGLSLYEYYNNHQTKAARFAQGMVGVTKLDRQISELRDEFPWASLGKGTVVDVGGGSGHVSMSLARLFPELDFIVQDISQDMLSQFRPDDLEGRVKFMQHSFFDPQPIHDASIFFIRQCLLNWNNEDCIRILQAFVPALEKCMANTPLLINEAIVPDLGVKTKLEERDFRQLDVAMFVLFGAKQRTRGEFERLLKQADERFEIVKVHSDGTMGLMEVHLSAN